MHIFYVLDTKYYSKLKRWLINFAINFIYKNKFVDDISKIEYNVFYVPECFLENPQKLEKFCMRLKNKYKFNKLLTTKNITAKNDFFYRDASTEVFLPEICAFLVKKLPGKMNTPFLVGFSECTPEIEAFVAELSKIIKFLFVVPNKDFDYIFKKVYEESGLSIVCAVPDKPFVYVDFGNANTNISTAILKIDAGSKEGIAEFYLKPYSYLKNNGINVLNGQFVCALLEEKLASKETIRIKKITSKDNNCIGL